ncbi:hypothetical protein O6V14_07035 [Sphingomonas faeni]
MKNPETKRHHWWPECLSRYWAGADGGVTRLRPSGDTFRGKPEGFGLIGHGHSIKLGASGETTPWDHNFEGEFQLADDSFPSLIQWLDSLERPGPPFEVERKTKIQAQTVDNARLKMLIECIVSLAVRSPMHRERVVALAESLRGPLPERERNVLIGANMQRMQRSVVRSISGRGKVLVLFSPEHEFVFGNGFFHNIYPPGEHLTSPKILVPITPWMSVLFCRPTSYRSDPALVTTSVTIGEADALNEVIQIYAKDEIFYRNEKPRIVEAYKQNAHLVFKNDRNSVEDWIHSTPGISPRDTSLDFLQEMIERQ